MKKIGLIGCLGLLAIALVLGLMLQGQYNRLVGLQEHVTTAWAQVENTYQRRSDLIPNLVNTVKGARDFERETFESVARARASVGQTNIQGAPDAEQLAQFQQSQGALSSALSRLLLVVERYPELKATDAFRDLQAQLEGTENRISTERRRFNEAARAYNTAARRFPTVIVARLMGFEQKPYFEAQEGAEKPPTVDFG